MDRNKNSSLLVFAGCAVATREGGVDRNRPPLLGPILPLTVATREGGVDRNNYFLKNDAIIKVATREGGVDRNSLASTQAKLFGRSPPARVAWIETAISQKWTKRTTVATREGGVDRNQP